MPSVQVYVNRKLSDVQKHGAASCIIREISNKLGKPKELVAVFFMETTGDMAFSGSMGGAVCPTVQLCAGGFSPGAVLDSCMAGIAAGFQHSGICPAPRKGPVLHGRCAGMMWLTVRCTEEISVSALAKLAFAITDAAHWETGVPIGDIRVEFRSYIPDSTYYTGANTEALQ